MYQPETVLAKREPWDDDHPSAPYNRVRVVGQSPINHGLNYAEWDGAQGQGVIIQPLDGFGSTLDEPYGKLHELYEVESVPDIDVEVPVRVRVTKHDEGVSPEDVFREEAREPEVEPVTEPKQAPSPLDGETITPEEQAARDKRKEEIREQATNPTEEA